MAAAYCLYSLQCTTLWEGATQHAASDAEAPPPANMLSASAETAAIRACARPCMTTGTAQNALKHGRISSLSTHQAQVAGHIVRCGRVRYQRSAIVCAHSQGAGRGWVHVREVCGADPARGQPAATARHSAPTAGAP